MTKPGLRKFRCGVCGTERELEAGIKTIYCCAQKMVEVVEEEAEEQEPTLKLKPRE